MTLRRFPNTDEARLKVLKTTYNKSKNINPRDLAFSQATFVKLRYIYPRFMQAYDTHRKSYVNRINAYKNCNDAFKKAKMYLSHFIQVLNLAILRDEVDINERKYLGIDIDDDHVPFIKEEEDLIHWGRKIIKGEKLRVLRGGNPIYNPKIALVNIEFERFITFLRYKENFHNVCERSLLKLEKIREEVDNIILKIWNEVEIHYSELLPNLKRKSAEKYGIKYASKKVKFALISKKLVKAAI
jgi:hypothetical protein